MQLLFQFLKLKSENVIFIDQTEYFRSNEFFPTMLLILVITFLEEQLEAVTVVQQVEKAVGERCVEFTR